jgi:hypothetical protein
LCILCRQIMKLFVVNPCLPNQCSSCRIHLWELVDACQENTARVLVLTREPVFWRRVISGFLTKFSKQQLCGASVCYSC